MTKLAAAHALVGGDVTSAGGTGTYDLHRWANEIQAGSYALMDTYYGRLGLPFHQALSVWTTVISVSPKWMVCDAGLEVARDGPRRSCDRGRQGLVLLG